MTSLRELVKKRYVDVIRSTNARWKTVVIDGVVHALWHGLLSHHEILAEGVQSVEFIERDRPSASSVPAVYILAPTSANVQRVLADYRASAAPSQIASSGKSRKGSVAAPAVSSPRYACAYVHFIEAIDDRLAQQLMQGLPADYLKALTELFVNFFPLESRVFSLKTSSSLVSLYKPPSPSAEPSIREWEEEIAWTSRAIVNALATLGEYPLIRYYQRDPLGPSGLTGSHLTQRLAERVQRDIDQYARENTDFPPVEEQKRPRGTLIITDRSMDLFAPFLHEFTYQAMCHDLLPITKDDKYAYSFRNANGELEEREALLGEDDKVWLELRHMHMKDALEKLVADFKQYATSHGGTFHSTTNGTSINDMKDMLASLPQLREAKDQLSLHLDIATRCMTIFEKQKLPLSASVEQCCATGCDAEGKTPKTLVEEMVPLLDDRSLSALDKVRIIALYVAYRDGVPADDKKRLFQHARLAFHEMDAVNNLVHLGLNVDKDSGKRRKPLFKHAEEEDSYSISRYQPSVKYLIESHLNGKLDESNFPYTRDAPEQQPTVKRSNPLAFSTTTPLASSGSLRSARPQWGTARARPTGELQPRVIVFVAGGMTYSEIRSAYQISARMGKDVYIGSHDILTPEAFVKDLTRLGHGDAHGLRPDGAAAKRQVQKASRQQFIPVPTQEVLERRFSQHTLGQGPPVQSMPRQGAPSQHAFASSGRGGSAGPPPLSSSGRPQQPQQPSGGQCRPPGASPALSSSSSNTVGSSQTGEKKKRKLFGF